MREWVKKSLFKNLQILTLASSMTSLRNSNLEEKFNDFLSKYDNVNSELQQCKKLNSHFLIRIIQLERNAMKNSQYSRRETRVKPCVFWYHWRSFGRKHLQDFVINWSKNCSKWLIRLSSNGENGQSDSQVQMSHATKICYV